VALPVVLTGRRLQLPVRLPPHSIHAHATKGVATALRLLLACSSPARRRGAPVPGPLMWRAGMPPAYHPLASKGYGWRRW
jgi:hypothetical protein